MANEFKVRKGLIVNGSGSVILDIQGSQGQLFSVTDQLSGSLFSVNDISGMPILGVSSDDSVRLGTFNREAIIVSGSNARITGSLFGTASWASNAITASNALTSSFVLNAVSASFAATASSVNPLVQNVLVTGSLLLSGSFTQTAGTGSFGGPVGIGTITPVYALDIRSGDLFITGSRNLRTSFIRPADLNETIYFQSSGGTAVGRMFMDGTAWRFKSSNAFDAINIFPNGRVGLLQTSDAGFSFDVNGTTRLQNNTQITGSLTAPNITGSLFGTASWAQNAVTSSYILNAVSASFASTASSADNFVIRQDATASNLLVSNTITAQTLVVQTITSSVDFVTGSTRFGSLLTNTHQFTGSVSITGSLTVTGVATINNLTGSLFGTASWANNATSASFVSNTISASFASTASSVNTLNQDVIITSSLTVGDTTLGPSENTLTLGPRGAGEGGQLGLQAPGGTYTSASMIDNYQDRFRILRGSNAGSDAEIATFNMHTRQFFLPSYTNASSYPGTATAYLGVNATGDVITITAGTVSSASFAATASLAFTALTASFVTSSNVFGPFGSNSILTSSFANSASFAANAVSASFASTASSVNPLVQNVLITGSLNISGSQTITLIPTASSVRGTLSVGGAPFNGTTSGFFAGTGSGTTLAINETGSFSGDLISAQVAGSSRFRLSSAGIVTMVGVGSNNGNPNSNGSITFYNGANSSQATILASNANELTTTNPWSHNGVGNFTIRTNTGTILMVSRNATDVSLTTRGASGQTADLLQLQNSSGLVQSHFDATGSLLLGTPSASNGAGILQAQGNIVPAVSQSNFTLGTSIYPWAGLVLSGSAVITGSIIASAGITGSLFGTSSWALNAVSSSFATTSSNATTASFVLNAVSASFASTASSVNPLVQNVQITGSTNLTGSLTVNGNSTVINSDLPTTGNFTQIFNVNASGSNRFYVRAAGDAFLANTLWLGALNGNNYISNGSISIRSNQGTPGTIFTTFDHNDGTRAIRAYSNSVVTLQETGGRNVLIKTATDSGFSLDIAAAGVSGSFRSVGTSIVSGSFITTGSFTLIGNEIITGSSIATGGYTGSLFGTASWALNAVTASNSTTASFVLNAVSASFAATASSADDFLIRQNATASNLLVNNTITAQTLVVQTITSSVDFVTGSTRFGSLLTNTHQFTGSVSITGSLSLNNDPVITQTPYNTFSSSIQSRVTTLETASGSFSTRVTNLESTASVLTTASASFALVSSSYSSFSQSYNTGSFTGSFTGVLIGTASWAENALTSSYILNAISASYSSTSSFVDTLNQDVVITGSLNTTGSVILSGLTSASQANVVSYDVVTGQLYYQATGSGGGSSVTASYALTSSNVLGGLATYIPLWDTDTSLTSSYLNQASNTLKTIYNGTDRGLNLNYGVDSYILGNAGAGNNTYLQVFDGGSVINVYTPNYTYFNDKVGVRIIPTNPGLAISGSLEVTGPGTTTITNTDVIITGSLNATGSVLLPGLTSSSFANVVSYDTTTGQLYYQATGSGGGDSVTASYALTASAATEFTIRNTLTLGSATSDYSTVASSIVGSNNLFTQLTGSYTSAFFKYTAANGTDARSGEVMAVWNEASVQFTDNSTLDIGSTTPVTCSVSIVGTDVQFNVQTNTSGWRIKSVATYM